MKRLHTALISMALGGVSPETVLGSRSSLCNAWDDETAGEGGYQTTGDGELGWYDANGQWQQAYDTGAASQQLMRAPARPAARPAPMQLRPVAARPAPRPAPMQARPMAAPAGPTAAQIQAIARSVSLTEAQVRAIVMEALASASPYGAIPPRPNLDEAMFPMGLGFVILSGGPPAVLTAGFSNVLPQRSFRGERLVLSTLRSSGALTVPVIVDTFKVGDYSQLVGGGSVPVETFAPDSFGVRLMLDGAVPGVSYTLNVSVPTAIGIPAGETITVVGTVIGRAGEAPQR